VNEVKEVKEVNEVIPLTPPSPPVAGQRECIFFTSFTCLPFTCVRCPLTSATPSGYISFP